MFSVDTCTCQVREQQPEEPPYGGQTAPESQTLYLSLVGLSVSSYMMIRLFQLSGFLQVVSFSNV